MSVRWIGESVVKMKNSTATTMRQLFRFGLLIIVVMTTISCNANFAAAAHGLGLPPAPFRYYDFNALDDHARCYDILPTKGLELVEVINHTVNCRTKPIITVNGMFPGPIIYVNEGDRIIVNVTNNSPDNMTIHFHGVRQVNSPWMDGVAYITMCPIQPGGNFVHDFTVILQRGTLLWHAHIAWERATVHGAFITYPADPYPFPKPHAEFPLVLAEWWYENVEQVLTDGLNLGGPFPVSDAMTINGHPGPTYNCSDAEGYTVLKAQRGKTYLLRIVNAALNAHLYFSVADHTLTVVEADAAYVYPFQTSLIFLSPGQTTNVLLTADQGGGTYYMSVRGYGRDDIPVVRPAAVFTYGRGSDVPRIPSFPAFNSTGIVTAFDNSLRTLYPGRVPLTVNRELFLTVGFNQRDCSAPPVSNNCTGLKFQGAVNNITFEQPEIAILQASYFNISGVFTEDFPDNPPLPFDYTNPLSPPPALRQSIYGTRIIGINFNDTVQIALQDTMVLGFEDHPFHLHGHNFYILGLGFGNYVSERDHYGLNLYDPPLRNTVSVPSGGWAVIRLKANNPGVWLFHCHLEKHTAWGMETVLHVHNGNDTAHSYNPPPHYLTPC